MTLVDAYTVLHLLCTADHGCPYCAADLLEQFQQKFPAYAGLAESLFADSFPGQILKGKDHDAPTTE